MLGRAGVLFVHLSECRNLAFVSIHAYSETIGLKYLNDSLIGWYPIMEVIDEVASALKMDRDVLARASIKAFLEKELRCIEAEIFEIRTKHDVGSIFELDEKLKRGGVREEDVLDDFQELDYLESRRDELLAAMKNIP